VVLRAVLCERAFTHVLDRGGLRRTWLRGRENVAKRYLVHVAAFNLGLIMRALLGAGTPRAAADLRRLWLAAGDRVVLLLLAFARTESTDTPAATAGAIVIVMPHHCPLSTGC
jgi:transposase